MAQYNAKKLDEYRKECNRKAGRATIIRNVKSSNKAGIKRDEFRRPIPNYLSLGRHVAVAKEKAHAKFAEWTSGEVSVEDVLSANKKLEDCIQVGRVAVWECWGVVCDM